MSAGRTVNGGRLDEIDRRSWLRRAVAAGAAFGCVDGALRPGIAAGDRELSPEQEAEQELERAHGPSPGGHAPASPRHLHSEQYQAVGDATESFMKLTLNDCESLAREYLAYYQEHGFDVKRPARRLTLVVFHR